MAKESSQERQGAEPHRVVVVVDEHSNPFELGCATEVFGLRRPELGRQLYDFRLCSPEPRTLMRDGFFTLTGVAGLEAADAADTLIVPNRPDTEVPRRPAVLDAVRRAHARGARLVGFCSGAFTLAEAGVLDGRRATAHWQWADDFQARFPSVRLEPEVLFVDDGDILTAAGSAAALDLGLHLVRRDHGAAVANDVARRTVLPPHRNGGQAQYVRSPVPEPRASTTAAARRWALSRLHETIGLRELAARESMSVRTFTRRFRDEVGLSPGQWLVQQRVERARALLETSDLPVDRIARDSGFGTAQSLRQHLQAAIGVTPTAYRRTFRAVGDGPGRG